MLLLTELLRGEGGKELLSCRNMWAVASDSARAARDLPTDGAIGLHGVEAEDATELLLLDTTLEMDIVLLAEVGDELLVVLLLDVVSEEDDLGASLDDRLDHAVEASGDFAGEVDLLQTFLDRVGRSVGHVKKGQVKPPKPLQ